jgi:hypothetical protein
MTAASEVLLAQARSQLARQEAAVDTLRTRATAVFSASGVVAALFASHLLSLANPSKWVYVAFAMLFVGVLVTIYVLVPRHMVFTEQLDDWWPWLDAAKGANDVDDAAAQGLAENLSTLWKLNQDPLRKIGKGFMILCIVFGLQVAAWVLAGIVA